MGSACEHALVCVCGRGAATLRGGAAALRRGSCAAAAELRHLGSTVGLGLRDDSACSLQHARQMILLDECKEWDCGRAGRGSKGGQTERHWTLYGSVGGFVWMEAKPERGRVKSRKRVEEDTYRKEERGLKQGSERTEEDQSEEAERVEERIREDQRGSK
eukprot:127049-Chlamydomonas_euryale.AAC.2